MRVVLCLFRVRWVVAEEEWGGRAIDTAAVVERNCRRRRRHRYVHRKRRGIERINVRRAGETSQHAVYTRVLKLVNVP